MTNWTKTTVKKLVEQNILEKPLDGNHGEIHPKKSEFVKSGIPFIMASDLVNGLVEQENCNFITRKRADSLRKGFAKHRDVLLSHKGTIGRSAILKTTHDYVVLTPQVTYYRIKDKQILDNRFLYYFFHSPNFQDEITSFAGGGSTRAYIGITKQLQLHIAFPSLEEQKRIVEILDKAFEGIERAEANTKKNLANAIELFNNSVFSNFSNESYKKYLVSDLVLSKKGAMRTGPFGSQLLHSEFVDRGVAVLGIDNAVNNQFQWGKRRFITEEKYKQLLRYTVKPGDVLITIMGTCGRCAVVPEDIPVAINTKHLCCISLDPEKCLPEFLHAYFLYHPTAQKFLNDRAKGSIMAGLNMTIIKELPVFLPSIEEQKDIVKRCSELLKSTKRLEKIYQRKLEALAELKQSILQKAFTGQLTT